jgi:WD40 repeat protein
MANRSFSAETCRLDAQPGVLFRVSNGGRPRPITPEGVTYCRVSPDGKLVAAGSADMSGVKLYTIDGGTARPIPGLQSGESLAWSSDPNFLYVGQHSKSSIRVFRLNLLTGQRTLFKEIAVPDEPGVCDMTHVLFSPDGKRLRLWLYPAAFRFVYGVGIEIGRTV